jgi:hypothetical protein
MSVTVDYFFNATKPLHHFAEDVNGILGCKLAPCEGDVTDFFCRFLSMEFSLYHHELVNDCNLNFEDYCFCIGVRIPSPDNDLLAIATEAMVAVAYLLHVRLEIHDGLLVRDVQTLLAKYDLRRNEFNETLWHDSVSAKFVEFPEHLCEISSREW